MLKCFTVAALVAITGVGLHASWPQPKADIIQRVNMKCGFKPFPPFGCQVGPCICDSSGRSCEWQMICR
jgi:hypothetical protein